MIVAYAPTPAGLATRPCDAGAPQNGSTQDAVWFDMLEPSREDDRLLESLLGIEIPTREEQADIEPSEILYAEHGALYMTAQIVAAVDTGRAHLAPVSFILTKRALVTVRYANPRPFAMFIARSGKTEGGVDSPEAVLAGLLETVLDRAADILQNIDATIDTLSADVFDAPTKRSSERQGALLRSIGWQGDLLSKVRESLLSIERMVLFVQAGGGGGAPTDPRMAMLRARGRAIYRDIQTLEQHASFASGKIQFILDATLGLINLEQNNIIKLFSVMAVIFMPPTMIASIYGMNFKHMPELDWTFGYPMAVALMLMSGIVPFMLFKWMKWL